MKYRRTFGVNRTKRTAFANPWPESPMPCKQNNLCLNKLKSLDKHKEFDTSNHNLHTCMSSALVVLVVDQARLIIPKTFYTGYCRQTLV